MAYRQWFRDWKRGNNSCLEFACDLSTHFDRWCGAAEVDSQEELHDLIILEQFKNTSVNESLRQQLRPLLWLMIMF